MSPTRIWIWGFACALILIVFSTLAVTEAHAENQTTDCTFAIPYAYYEITGGIHADGWYVNGIRNELAVDLGAGTGAALLSPIPDGVVVNKGTDQWANPFIVIEGMCWKVFLLHGVYTAEVGQELKFGQQFGTEASIGNSTGPHSHISLWNKIQGRWEYPPNAATNGVRYAEPVYAIPTPTFRDLGNSLDGTGGFPIGEGVPLQSDVPVVHPTESNQTEATSSPSSRPRPPYQVIWEKLQTLEPSKRNILIWGSFFVVVILVLLHITDENSSNQK